MSVPATTTAAYITERGPADAIRVGELPVSRPGVGEVLVRTEALAVNHVDTFVRSGAYRTAMSFPFVIGRDLVGTVVESGPETDGFPAGARVWCNSLGYDGRQGAFAEYVAVPAERLYHLPDGPDGELDPAEAVAVLHTGATAHLGLFRAADLRIGETVVVNGAAGGVGSAVVQLASAAGARVIATARPEDAQWCRDCGATRVLDYCDSDVVDQIAAHAPDGVDVYWNNAPVHDLEATVPLLARGGRIVVLSAPDARPVLPVGELYQRDASVRGFAISNAGLTDIAAAAQTVESGLSTGRLRARIGARLPLRDAAQAHRLQEEGGVRGRIVVLP